MIQRFRRTPAFTGFVLFIVAIALNVIVQGIYSGNALAFFRPASVSTLVMSNAQFLLVCMAQSLLLISGTMDLSIGIQLALVNVVCITISDTLGMPVPVGWLVGILSAVVASVLCGLGCVVLRLPPLLVGYAMTYVIKGVNVLIMSIPGGKVPKAYWKPYQSPIGGVVPVSLLIIIAVFLFWVYLKHTRFGKHIYAVGGSPRNAFAAGIDPVKVQMKAFIIKGVITGIAGICLTLMTASGNPLQAEDYGLRSLSACIMGGLRFGGWGSMACAVFGGGFFIVIGNTVYYLFSLLPKLIPGFVATSYWQNMVSDVILLFGLFMTIVTAKGQRETLKQGAINQLKRGEKYAK